MGFFYSVVRRTVSVAPCEMVVNAMVLGRSRLWKNFSLIPRLGKRIVLASMRLWRDSELSLKFRLPEVT